MTRREIHLAAGGVIVMGAVLALIGATLPALVIQAIVIPIWIVTLEW